jgi:VWFA-related protein
MTRSIGARRRRGGVAAVVVGALLLLDVAWLGAQRRPARDDEGFRFRSGVDLVNVTVTVTDRNGRFVPGLTQDDFVVYDDGARQEIAYFDSERVPVSLGIAIDASGSMAGDKMRSARQALERFLFELLDPQDEVFLYRFSDAPDLVQEWTSDHRRLSRALGYLSARGGTALYDTVAEAVPFAQSGQHRKKALVVISDGNDTASHTQEHELKPIVRESEVMVYAVGIEGFGDAGVRTSQGMPRLPIPFPFPSTGRRNPFPTLPPFGQGGQSGRVPPGMGGTRTRSRGDGSNIRALREITDESGGRTEVVRGAHDIEPATASIADELSRQYYLGYAAPHAEDGRWHSIRVEVRDRGYHVRARRGYVAAPHGTRTGYGN